MRRKVDWLYQNLQVCTSTTDHGKLEKKKSNQDHTMTDMVRFLLMQWGNRVLTDVLMLYSG